MANEMYRGPYASRIPRCMVRVASKTLLVVNVEVMSQYYPVTIDFGQGATVEDADGTAQKTYSGAGTYTITATCPRGSTSTTSVTVVAS